MERKCNHCDGTGYGSAARNSGNPNMIGIWECYYCGGRGKFEHFEITPEEAERLRRRVQIALTYAKRKGIINDSKR